jgi:hypothetical protein
VDRDMYGLTGSQSGSRRAPVARCRQPIPSKSLAVVRTRGTYFRVAISSTRSLSVRFGARSLMANASAACISSRLGAWAAITSTISATMLSMLPF